MPKYHKSKPFVLSCHLCEYEAENLGSHLRYVHGAELLEGQAITTIRLENAIMHADEVAAVRAVKGATYGQKPGRIHPDDRIFAAALLARKENRWAISRRLGLNTQMVSQIFAAFDAGELPHRDLVVCA